MHAPVLLWVANAQNLYGPWDAVVEFGSLNVNGSARCIVNCQRYVGIDIRAGRDVDIVCSAVDYTPESPPDAVLCLEVLEHAEPWKDIIKNAARVIGPHGTFVMTCATDPRAPHSVDGRLFPEGEFYANIDPEECKKVILEHFETCEREVGGGDLRIIARVRKI
jgi:hypothetical protein